MLDRFRPRRPGPRARAAAARPPLESLESRVLLSAGAPVEVAARHVFYNNSAYDGGSSLATAADDRAIASDKDALLPGEAASFANYTSYTRGINGVMVDFVGLDADAADAISADDFAFRVGVNGDPESWAAGPAPASVSVRRPSSLNGGTRVTLTWRDGAIRNAWLQVTVAANDDTRLASPDVFFFGNLTGETGDAATPGRVTSKDLPRAASSPLEAESITNRHDFDRNGSVGAGDVAVLRRNLYRRLQHPASLTGAGMGLGATYFDDPEFGGVTGRRVDRTVNFAWGGSPAPGIEAYTYSARWLGQIRPGHSEQYTFHTTSNDRVRLWVDGRLIIDNWTNHAATQNSGRVTLEAGRKYDLRLEYYQHLGASVMKLEWSSPSVDREVVPTSRLYPAPPRAASEAPGGTGTNAPPVAGDWRMIFRDEFNGDTLDPVWHKAQYWDRDRTVVGGGELQAYDATGVSVSDGVLRLTARREAKHGMPYVSGLVQTGGYDGVGGEARFNFLYGYMEVRAKLPAGKGLWPAVWMMPASYEDANGELDVVEMIGSEPTTSNFALHRHGRDSGDEWIGANLTRGFHTFGVDWQSDHVTWYVDGIERARVTDPALICPEAMYPILNLAVGGDWPGAPDSSTPFPAAMEVDYVRVWQDAAD